MDFIKSINEWKKKGNSFKKLNEGGGSGIAFKATATVQLFYQFTKLEDGKVGVDLLEKKITVPSFDAEGYDDGMNDVKSFLINWKLEDFTWDSIKDKDIVMSDTIQDLNDFLDNKLDVEDCTLKNVMSSSDIKTIGVSLYYTVDFNTMHFAGYTRGKFEIGSLVFNDADNKTEVSTDEAYFTINEDNDIYSLDEFSMDNIVPALNGYATEDFLYFYKDVFEYNAIDDYEKKMYEDLVIEGTLDNELIQYLDANAIDISIEDFKAQLKIAHESTGKIGSDEDIYEWFQTNIPDMFTRWHNEHTELAAEEYKA